MPNIHTQENWTGNQGRLFGTTASAKELHLASFHTPLTWDVLRRNWPACILSLALSRQVKTLHHWFH